MGYSVIYLENHKCKVCEAIKRNVIEPVAVFIPKGEENLKKELENLNSEELEERLNEFYQNIKGKIITKIPIPYDNHYTYQTCILHCEKENEIWMENYNIYEMDIEDRRKFYRELLKDGIANEWTLAVGIRWENSLCNEFWRRLRAYRFAIDYYKEKWDKLEGTEKEKWEQFSKQFHIETQKDIEQDKNLIIFNFRNLESYYYYYYPYLEINDTNFISLDYFNFPKFQANYYQVLLAEKTFILILKPQIFFILMKKSNLYMI